MLSLINSQQLMSGKIVGHFLLGIIQLTFWLLMSLPLIWPFFDVPILDYLMTFLLPVMVLFALRGYLMDAGLFVDLVAIMEDIQSASNAQGLVVKLPFLSMMFKGPLVTTPHGLVARLATLSH